MENPTIAKKVPPLDYAPPEPHRQFTKYALRASMVIGITLLLVFLGWLTEPHRVHEGSTRLKCQSDLRQIGQAILLYTNDTHGIYPDNFEQLLLTQDITSAIFVCPSTNDNAAPGATTQAVADNLHKPNACSYIYLGKGLTTQTATPDMVIACEPPANHAGEGMNALFGDGHMEFIEKKEAAKIMNQISAGKWPVKSVADH